MKSVLEKGKFSQVGFVVKDIEEAKERFAKLFGCEVPPAFPCGSENAETVFMGQPAPALKGKLAFFDLVPGVQLELIEPNEEPSTWNQFLEENGEGIHHIAFQVKDMDEVIKECEAEGMKLVQHGFYDDKSGRYAYMDAREHHKCFFELLESF